MDNSTFIESPVKIVFSWYDYILFVFMLVLSALIGIYFAFFAKQKQTDANQFLHGGKTMNVIPIAFSLIASSISGTIMMGVPTDVYTYGSTYILTCVAVLSVFFISYKAYIPIFFKLKIFSTYEYLELRFNKHLRVLSSIIFTIATILHIPMILYAPALAFAQATGANVYSICWLISVICIFYTTLGGLKAVVWTDALQLILMIGSITLVLCLGISNVGGFAELFRRAYDGGRLTYDFDIDPRKRDSVWAFLIAFQFNFLGYTAIGQGCVQKYLALPSMLHVKKALIYYMIGFIAMTILSVLTGVVIYANYKDCDPISDGKIEKPDQILAFFIMEISQNVPGLAGFYIAGLISAALSSLSAMINSLSGTIYEDFISPFISEATSQKSVSNILKFLVVIIGAIGTAFVLVFDKLGSTILPIQLSLMGVTMGALVGLFSLGMLVPMANSKGAMSGTICSLVIMSIIISMTQMYQYQGLITYPKKIISTEGCSNYINVTITTTTEYLPPLEKPLFIFLVSHWYYAMMGFIIVFAVAVPISYFTSNKTDKPISRDLISPIMHWCIKDESLTDKNLYYNVEEALKVVYKDGNEEVKSD